MVRGDPSSRREPSESSSEDWDGSPSDATEEKRPVSGQQQCGSGVGSEAACTPAEGVGSARATATACTTHAMVSGKAPPAKPSPAKGPLPPPPAPPAPPQVPPPPPLPARVSSAPKTPPKTPPKAKAGEPTSPKASPGAKASPAVDLVTPKSPEAKAASLVGELPHRPFRVGQEEHWKLRQLPLHRGTVCR